jgi:energy-coupling factor transporter ATP-binding protein EcfA2
MSTQRLERIEIRAFKAFKHLDFKLDGRHLLAFGGNGAGKSSLYWTLYTFLQSAAKDTPNVAKYFDDGGTQNLLNVHATPAELANAAVVVSIKDEARTSTAVYSLSKELHDTKADPDVKKASLASDFITYRVLSSFYQFRNSQAIDLWPVFEQEILPFAQGTSTKDIAALWQKIKATDPFVQSKASGEAAWYRKARYERFDADIARFNQALDEVLTSISAQAQIFYDAHFAEPGTTVVLKVGATAKASKYDRYAHRFTVPSIGFEIELNGNVVRKPQSFLNEAKLSQLALSVRFGATLAHLHDSPMKLLVLDDLLISLDMNNRMKVVDIILSDTFAEHQKIILTHDLGFFNEFRRRIGPNHTDWSFQHFKTVPATGITLKEAKTEVQKAEDYLNGHSLDEAAICLRRAADDSAKRLREWLSKEKLPPGQFFTLTENLREAKNRLLQGIPKRFYREVLEGTPIDLVQKLVPDGIADLDGLTTLTAAEKGRIKSKRGALRKLLTNTHWSAMENVRLIDDVLATTERVLNPGAHGGESPLYEAEVTIALDLIRRLESIAP